MEVFSQYAVAASREAFDMAGLDMAKEDPYQRWCNYRFRYRWSWPAWKRNMRRLLQKDQRE